MTAPDLTFSIVVNTLDRAIPLRTLLQSLEQQSYPHFEVIVVVGPTRDNTLEVLSKYQERVRALRCPTANLSRSRNIGLLAARGDIVAFMDDDAIPCQRWLEQLAQLFQDPSLDVTGGMVYAIHPDFSPIQYRIGIYSSLSEQVDVRSSWVDRIVPPGMGSQWVARTMGTNMAFRRQVLLDIGGFDEFYGYIAEESDLVFRLTNAGKHIHPVMEAVVYHAPASSRNRRMFTVKGRWWLRSKSRVYFGIKNGLAAGDAYRTIALRSLMSVGAHLWWYENMRREGKLDLLENLIMDLREVRSGVSGILGGLFRPRQLIKPALLESARNTSEPILEFQDGDSAKQSSVDPIRGRSPSVSLPDPPLRICLLSGSYPPAQYDGVGRLTNLMARGLFECGHTVHVITRGEREQVSFYDGAYVHQVPCRPDRYDRYQRFNNLHFSLNYSHTVYDQVKRLILNDGIQVVDSPLWQFEGLVTLVSEIVPVGVRLVTGLRQITELHKDRVDEFSLMGDLEQMLLKRAKHLMPNTQATWNAIRRVYDLGSESERHTIVPYGIVPASDDQIRPFDLGRVSDKLTVLFVGRLEKRKGILDLFQAISLVLKGLPDVKFVIAGSDNSRNDGFRQRTGADYPTFFARQYPELTERVKFMGGVSDEILQSLYQSCDLFVAPSLYESFGLIYLEAMNYAKAVIGCRAGGIPEVVDDGVTGLLVDPETPVALSQAILSLCKSPAKLREMGIAGRHQLLAKFTYVQMAQNFAQVYRRMIHDAAASQSRPSSLPKLVEEK